MSGIEVAGLVLGAVPVLIEAIDIYKKGANKLRSGFKKRKVIEKVGWALRLQKCIIEEITRNVLAQSGCDDVAGANDAQLRTLLQDKHIQEMVNEFLGTANAQVFSNALIDCMTDVSNATVGLASLVPGLAHVKDQADVQAVLNANAASEKGRVQLFARLSMVFNFENLNREIEALDQSTNVLDKFARNVIANRQPGQNASSRSAAKLAKALQVVRNHAANLHLALTRQWVTPCHQRHELKIFLEDRITELKSKQVTSDARASCFKVVFVGGRTQPPELWHETLFHVEAEDPQTNRIHLPLQGPRVHFSNLQNQPTNSRLDVLDICAAITSAASSAYSPIFYLAGTSNMAMTLHTPAPAAIQSSCSASTTLRKIFQDRHNQKSPSLSLPWKWRMALALKIASSFLQFMRTPWAQPSWSASNIHIPYNSGNHDLDLSSPFLSADFNRNSSPSAIRQAQVKEDLLELGILLLEIWHEINLEARFAQALSTPGVTCMTRACALEWLDDLQNPVSNLYFRAASFCISGLLTPDPRASEWDHPDLWKSVCANVIDPLSEVARI